MAARKFYGKGYSKPYQRPEIQKAPRFTPTNGWGIQFEAAFDFAVNGTGHGVIEASAGSGKTTCLVELCYRYLAKNPHHSILCIAFNRDIKTELMTRMPVGVDVETCHSFGFKSVCRVWGDGKNVFDLQGPKGSVAMGLACQAIGDEEEKYDDRDALCQTMSLAKTRLASTPEQIVEIMDRWGIETTYKRTDFANYVLGMMEQTRKAPVSVINKGKGGKQYVKKAISYDDQVWLPIVNGWAPPKKYDLVLVDEAQDLSPARTEVAMRALKD